MTAVGNEQIHPNITHSSSGIQIFGKDSSSLPNSALVNL
jgi:hypothetical protein